MISVYAIGTEVYLGTGEDLFRGVITGIAIYPDLQRAYRVAWWSGRERKEEWLYDFEVEATTELRTRIGFLGAEASK